MLVDEVDGTNHVYGEKLGSSKMPGRIVVNGAISVPRVELVVKKSAFWMRLILFADMGFSEAYMLGEVDCTDLTAFFQVYCCHCCPRTEGPRHANIPVPCSSSWRIENS